MELKPVKPQPEAVPEIKNLNEREKFLQAVATFAPAKRDLLTLLRFANYNSDWELFFPGNKADAIRYVGNMRVHMSRLRTEAVAKGHIISHFSINVVKMEDTYRDGERGTLVTLQKARNDGEETSDALALILKNVEVKD